MPEPWSLDVLVSDLDDEEGTYRNMQGLTHRSRIAVKTKLSCSWGMLSPSDVQTILNALSDEFSTIKYPTPWTSQIVQGVFYVSDRNVSLHRVSENGTATQWQTLSLNLIER